MPEPITSTTRTLDDEEIARAGRSLFLAERAGLPRRPLSEDFPAMSVADAYAVQEAYARLRLAGGARLVGRKIGATSRAIQELFAIDTPDFGHLFADMRVDADEPIPTARLIQPMAEPEIAFVLGEEVAGPGVTADHVLAATRGVSPCIEVIDSRIEEWRIRFVDTVADNGSSARFVLGSLVPVEGLDLAAEEVEFRRNGREVQRGRGDAVLGHPANAVAWLANAIAPFGGTLPAGALVLSGSFTRALTAQPGDRYEAIFSGIGSVSCIFDPSTRETR